jgi:hypothetical protein
VDADDLDKEQLDQLHAATLKASDSCFELKKLCASVLVPTAALTAVLSRNRLNAAVFVAGLLVVLVFWLADSVSYFYQRKLRSAMVPIWRRLADRCPGDYPHIPLVEKPTAVNAALNSSMSYYLILAAFVMAGLILFEIGLIG